MDLFSGITWDFGFTAQDIMTNGLAIVAGVAVFVLLGAAYYFAPKIIALIAKALTAFASKVKA